MSAVTVTAASRRRRQEISGIGALKLGLLIFFAAVLLMPIYVVLITSFKSGAEYGAATAWSLP